MNIFLTIKKKNIYIHTQSFFLYLAILYLSEAVITMPAESYLGFFTVAAALPENDLSAESELLLPLLL